MDTIVGFNDLQVGQRVKIKGKPGEGGAFVAYAIDIKEPKDQAEIEGFIQSIDHPKNTLRICNREYALPDGLSVKNLQHLGAGLKSLKAGDLVKLKGTYSASKGFLPEKIAMKQNMGFNVQELQGFVDKIDRDKKILEVLGFTVLVSEKTEIEGF